MYVVFGKDLMAVYRTIPVTQRLRILLVTSPPWGVFDSEIHDTPLEENDILVR